MRNINADYLGNSSNQEFNGKRVKKAFYVGLGGFDPMTFDLKRKYSEYLSMVGQNIQLNGNKKPVTIKGLGKKLVPTGFGSTLCFEFCYV